jgi:hypothetical protein
MHSQALELEHVALAMPLQTRSLKLPRGEVTSKPAINRLPPEILAETFLACLPSDEFLIPSANTAPMSVSHVCGQWRGVAVSTPKLWCSMEFVIQERDANAKTALFSTWLERSRNHPLQLSISFWQSHHPDIIDAIIRVSNRLESISFFLPASSWQSLTQIRGNLSRLRRISINTSHPDTFRGKPFLGFSEAPMLDRVDLGFPASGIELPWSQITRATIRSQDVDECLRALRRATKIKVCTFVRCDPFTYLRHRYAAPVTLVPLRSLHIIEETGTCRFLDSLTVPNLREIAFSFNWFTDWPNSKFLQFLTRSSCALEKLVLSHVDMRAHELIECLRMMPSLVKLRIEGSVDVLLSNNVVDGLKQKGTQQPLVPNLRFLALEGVFAFCDDHFADMLESRWDAHPHSNTACLQYVRLAYHKIPSSAVLMRLQRLQDSGLDVDIVHAEDPSLITWPLL